MCVFVAYMCMRIRDIHSPGPLQERPRAGCFRATLLLYIDCVRSWCNWRAGGVAAEQTKPRNPGAISIRSLLFKWAGLWSAAKDSWRAPPEADCRRISSRIHVTGNAWRTLRSLGARPFLPEWGASFFRCYFLGSQGDSVTDYDNFLAQGCRGPTACQPTSILNYFTHLQGRPQNYVGSGSWVLHG